MKRFSLILLTGAILFCGASVFGQGKAVEKSEFDRIRIRAYQFLKTKPHREISISESGVRFNVISRQTKEFASLERVRSVGYHKTGSGTDKIEEIFIGDTRYMRRNDGEWTISKTQPMLTQGKATLEDFDYKLLGNAKVENERSAAEPRRTADKVPEKKTVSGASEVKAGGGKKEIPPGAELTVEKTSLSNQTAFLYQATEKVRSDASGKEMVYIRQSKYWIDEEGLFLKIVEESKPVGNYAPFRQTKIFEYDANLKIEAPNVKESKLDRR